MVSIRRTRQKLQQITREKPSPTAQLQNAFGLDRTAEVLQELPGNSPLKLSPCMIRRRRPGKNGAPSKCHFSYRKWVRVEKPGDGRSQDPRGSRDEAVDSLVNKQQLTAADAGLEQSARLPGDDPVLRP